MAKALPTGPGWFIWQARRTGTILTAVADSRASWIAVKGGDGTTLLARNVRALLAPARAAGVAVYAWTVTYLKDPAGEAQVAAALKDLGVDGVIADAETWDDGMGAQATLYLRLVRAKVGAAFPCGMTGMSNPGAFPSFPWNEFEAAVDFQMPQWYANAYKPHMPPAAEFVYGLKGYRAIGSVPVIPIVATYGEATAQDVTDVAHLAASYGLGGWGAYRLETATAPQIAAMRIAAGVLGSPARPTLETRVQGVEKAVGTLQALAGAIGGAAADAGHNADLIHTAAVRAVKGE